MLSCGFIKLEVDGQASCITCCLLNVDSDLRD